MKISFEIGDRVWFIHWNTGNKVVGVIEGIGIERICCAIRGDDGRQYGVSMGRLNHVF
jgi:hypothetical protein